MSINNNSNQDFMAWNSPNGGGNSGGSGGGRGDSGSSGTDKGSGGWGARPSDGSQNDPWGRTGRKASQADLDAILNKFKNFIKGGRGFGSSRSSKGRGIGSLSISVALSALLAIYVISGFYTVREAERGVVLRFGKVYDVVEPGLSWKFSGIDEVYAVDIEQVRAIQSAGSMLTEDENLVNVEMDVQYRISDPVRYLFSAVDPDNSLTEATDSALRYVVGHTIMDDILTSGREMVRQNTRDLLVSIIEPYNMGLTVVDVNFLPARAPEQVKAAFDDAIAAQEDEQRFVREAEAYANEVLPRSDGRVQRIRQEAEAYRSRVVLDAQGEVARFEQVLPEYLKAPEITRTRIYLETMQEVLSNSAKVIVDTKEGQNPLMYLPLNELAKAAPAKTSDQDRQGLSPLPAAGIVQTTEGMGTDSVSGDNAVPLLPNGTDTVRGGR